jgi:hypothetical protein
MSKRLLANATTSEERMGGRFQQAFTELTATLSSTLITQLAATQQVLTQPASPVGVDDTPEGEITERSAVITGDIVTLDQPYCATLGPALATTVTPSTLLDEDYHIDTQLWGPYIAPGLELTPPPPTSRRPTNLETYM